MGGECAHDGPVLCVIGAGAMGGAIARGARDQVSGLWAIEPHEGRAEAIGATRVESPEGADVVVLAVKPHLAVEVLRAHRGALAHALTISICAGVRLETLEGALGGTRVIRAMPNLPLSVGCGATALAAGAGASEADVELALRLFGAMGAVAVMDEATLDVAGAISGCGPAYLALFVDALTRAAVREGLPAAVARDLVLATMEGTARSLADGTHPRAYMERVMSPGGTTVRAVDVLEGPLMEGTRAAVEAALERTRELAGEAP